MNKRTPETFAPKGSLLNKISTLKTLPAILAIMATLSTQVSGCVSSQISVTTQSNSVNGQTSSSKVEIKDGEVIRCETNGDGKSVIIIDGEEIKCNK